MISYKSLSLIKSVSAAPFSRVLQNLLPSTELRKKGIIVFSNNVQFRTLTITVEGELVDSFTSYFSLSYSMEEEHAY